MSAERRTLGSIAMGGITPLLDTLLSICASSEDPIAEGRHKVWGSRPLWVPPQTSTIASHVPKATGMAFALARARRLGVDPGLPADAIVCCTFGDASANHAAALAGIHAARYAHRRGNPVPILFVCEDNQYAATVRTSEFTAGEGIVARARSFGLPSESIDGNDAGLVFAVSQKLLEGIRNGAGPALRC